jgi:hypothetical protein
MAEFVSPWQGFGGVCDFGIQTSSSSLRMTELNLTHLAVSYKKKATHVDPDLAVDTCGRWLRSTEFRFLLEIRYAILA